MNEEILYRAIELKARSEEVEKQLSFINEQIIELGNFKEGLKFLKTGKDNHEILAPIGKGVYVKSSLIPEKLFVEVGAGVIVRKTVDEAGRIVNEQIKKFNEIKFQLREQLEIYTNELGKMFEVVERIRREKE